MPRLQTPTANCPSLVRITIIDGTPTEVTESNSDVYILKEKILKLMKSPQVMVLALIALIKYHQLTYLLLNVSPSHPLKKMIGEKCHLPYVRQTWR